MRVTQEAKVNSMNKIVVYIVFTLIIPLAIHAQDSRQLNVGAVSYITPRSVYVRFEDATDMVVSDTLMVLIDNQWKKALIVEMVSSKSCITKAFITDNIMVGFKVAYQKRQPKEDVNKISKPSITLEKQTNQPIVAVSRKDSLQVAKTTTIDKPKERKQTFDGRISVSSNGSMDEREKAFNRVRTSMSFDLNHINNSKFSLQNYITYRHRLGVSAEQAPSTFKDDFKVYTLSLNYEPNDKTTVSLGRRINDRTSNMGAIDGLQIDHKYKKIVFGGFSGFRPDYLDYSFNASLLQIGGFIAHEIETSKGQIQTSLAFAEQQNHGKTDRRFLYFQHSNAILKKLSLFYSLELDLFQNINDIKTNHINLTSTYISLRYKPFKKLSMTSSYDNRRNIIYYESYRTYIDQLINQETRQGIRLNANYNLSKYINLNASGFYRYQESRPKPTKNYVVSLTISQVMGIGSSLNFTINTMNTYYFDGSIYGARLTKDLFKSKVSAELNYRKVDYRFFNTEQPRMQQNIVGGAANFYGKNRTSIMLSYEGTFEPNKVYNRYYITVLQRIKSK